MQTLGGVLVRMEWFDAAKKEKKKNTEEEQLASGPRPFSRYTCRVPGRGGGGRGGFGGGAARSLTCAWKPHLFANDFE